MIKLKLKQSLSDRKTRHLSRCIDHLFLKKYLAVTKLKQVKLKKKAQLKIKLNKQLKLYNRTDVDPSKPYKILTRN